MHFEVCTYRARTQFQNSYSRTGLAETLRSELILYDCTVHIMFPGNIDSPGYVEENRVKPKITLEIESTDKPTAPEVLANELIQGNVTELTTTAMFTYAVLGVQHGDFHIAPDMLSNIFRSSTIGATPHHNILLDGLYAAIGWVRKYFIARGCSTEHCAFPVPSLTTTLTSHVCRM